MTLELAPMTVNDVDAYMAIRQAAFGDTIFRIFFVRPLSPATIEKLKQDFCDQIMNNKTAHFLKVIDTDTGEMIAGGKWKVFEKELTDAELEKELTLPSPTPDSDPAMWNAFMRLLADAKKEIMGKRPYWRLDSLTTHPKHHRRGAGALLISWGLARADEAGLETYVEAF